MAASSAYIYIYSNDGLTKLTTFYPVMGDTTTVTITDTGAEYRADNSVNVNFGTYTYSGDKVFIGLATSANATEPTYAVGDTFTFPAYASNDLNLYIVEAEPTPPTKIKSPVVVIKQKVKQVVIDNANMTIDIYTKEVPATEATVTITNTATNSKYTAYINDDEYTVSPNSSITITVPIGTTLTFEGSDVTSGMGYWMHTSSTGEITHDSNPYMTYTINGSGTITGYIYDAD